MTVVQERLVELPEGLPFISEHEVALTGASGLLDETAAELQLGQTAWVKVRGEVVGVRVEKRRRPEAEGGGEYLVRKVVVKADGGHVEASA